MLRGREHAQHTVLISADEEFNGRRLRTILHIRGQASLVIFTGINKWPEMKFSRAIKKVEPHWWSIRMGALLRLIAVRRNKPCEHYQHVDSYQKPQSPRNSEQHPTAGAGLFRAAPCQVGLHASLLIRGSKR